VIEKSISEPVKGKAQDRLPAKLRFNRAFFFVGAGERSISESICRLTSFLCGHHTLGISEHVRDILDQNFAKRNLGGIRQGVPSGTSRGAVLACLSARRTSLSKTYQPRFRKSRRHQKE